MSMKEHILMALREQFDDWEKLLAKLGEEQITTPNFEDDWSVQDFVNHLWGWQQISVARMHAGVLDLEPEFPGWLMEFPEWDEDANQTNAWIYKNFHGVPWADAHEQWSQGYLRLIELGGRIAEKDLLDGGRYEWLKGYSLAFILLASYEHHQEHLEKLTTWLQQHGIN
jgi:hypothetical protein